jgi:hypothetical protein
MLKSSARKATQLMKLRPYKMAVIHALQPCDPAGRVNFCSCFLQSVVKSEIDPQLTFFSDEAWFHLQGYINTLNNYYRSSQNPHVTQEVLLHQVKICVWCAISARTIVEPMFFNEKINCERYVQVILRHFFPEIKMKKDSMAGTARLSYCPHSMYYICAGFSPVSSGTELSAVVFGQQVHPILVLVIFSSGVV